MKKIIRWLADVSGVSREVRIETIREIGGRIYQDHYWWNGGIMYPKGRKTSMMNAFYLYGLRMKNDGVYPDIQQVRDKVMELEDNYIGDVRSNGHFETLNPIV